MNIETIFGQSSTRGDSGLILKSNKEIDTMRKAGKVVALIDLVRLLIRELN